MEKIYFDNASTTSLNAEVLNAMLPVMTDSYGNSESVHLFGREAQDLVDSARDIIAETINAKSNEIYFTGSGSEANTWAIVGVAMANRDKGNHIITSKIEHVSVLNACAYLEKNGFEVTYLDVDKNGFIRFDKLQDLIRSETLMIAIMGANNEIGTIQNIKAIARTAHEKNIIFMTDAVQLYGHMEIDVQDMEIDVMTMSAHKLNGPKGVGCLYLKNGIKIDPIIFGGNQERGKRGGTANTPGIVGFARASEIAHSNMRIFNHKLKSLSDYFVAKLTESVENIIINAETRQKLPHIISVTFVGVDGESLMTKLDMNGIAVSMGSACTSNSLKVSHVISAIGIQADNARSTIRFSFSTSNTFEEIDKAIAIIKQAVDELRAYSSTYSMKIRKRKGDRNV